jgi:serine/threonine protein kinase
MIGQLLTGRYLILKKLGLGGFSETYLARDKYLPRHPLCVVKCLSVSSGSAISLKTAQQLFETEARILDQLGRQHPQIPTLYAYCHEHEYVYQVQEYIDGESLRSWVGQGRQLSGDAGIELLREILPVLDYIHSHRVIHRDIKPSNLIRRRRDGKIVLIDFGAACLLSETDTQTEPESDDTPIAIGTPGYMPDEQHLGMSQMNSDLYSLGILIIQLLTGVQPHQFQQDLISGELNWQTHLPQQSRSFIVNSGLGAILEQMVRSHPHNRYPSAAAVLEALQALPYCQRPGRASVKRWLVPNWQRSLQQARTPVAVSLLLLGMLGAGYFYSHGDSVASLSRLALLTQSPAVDLSMLYNWPIQFEIDRLLVAPNSAMVVAAGSDYALHLWTLSDGSMRPPLVGHAGKVNALSFSPDNRLLVSGSDDRTVRLWDIAANQLVQTLDAQEVVTAVAISADAQTLASGSRDGTIRLWDLPTGALLRTIAASETAITALVYGTAPHQLISASGNRLSVWDVQTGSADRQFAGHTETIVDLQVVDDNRLISVGGDRTLMWNLEREELMQVCSENTTSPLTVSMKDEQMIAVNASGSLRIWQHRAGHLAQAGIKELGQNLDAALSPDHRFLVSWKPDHHLQVWQMTAPGSSPGSAN